MAEVDDTIKPSMKKEEEEEVTEEQNNDNDNNNDKEGQQQERQQDESTEQEKGQQDQEIESLTAEAAIEATNAMAAFSNTSNINNNNNTDIATANNTTNNTTNNTDASTAITTTNNSPQKVTPPALPLEWTKLGQDPNDKSSNIRPIRYPSDVMEFTKDDTYLEIIGTAGQKITNMGKDLMKQVSTDITHLVLRSHLIEKMEGIKGMHKLELLELYDNQVEYLDELGGDDDDDDINDDGNNDGNGGNISKGTGYNLKTLDMSYNMTRSMEPVKFCANLVELYLANNKIKKIEGLSSLIHLRKIDLGANRIRTMDGNQLSPLINLEELWLGKNKIEKIEGIETLTKLRRLDVQSNRLTSIEGLTGQIDSLEELYLAHNGIDEEGAMKETGLSLSFSKLTTLDLSKNRLTSCTPFRHLDTLNELWLSQNNISTFEDVEPIARLGTRDGAELTEVYLEHNPIYKDFEYRKKLKEIIPSLEQIDANLISTTGYGSVNTNMAMSPEAVIARMKLLQDKAVSKAQDEAAAAAAAEAAATATTKTEEE